MEAFERIQVLGHDRKAYMALAENAYEEALTLIDQARDEGYSVENIARAIGVSRQTCYAAMDRQSTEPTS